MVYYHTSGNVRMLRNIIIDYGEAVEVSPYEYMKSYIEKCPETIEDTKLSWIAETFLSYYKHEDFLKEIASHLSEELSGEEQDYFMIIFHAVIFRIEPKDMQLLYKCIFNLNRSLLNTFTKFLSNNEVLTFISQVAQAHYDTNYITQKIIGPLFEWQPYISEMGHSYAEYVKKMENRKIKPPTVPVQMNVLNRKSKEPTPPAPSQQFSLPSTPPNSLHVKKKRMLTKSTIDQRLKQIHEKNKQKAIHLLNDVKSKDYHYAKSAKSEKYYKRISSIKDEMEGSFGKCLTRPRQNVVKNNNPQVKETAATVKRLKKRIQMEEEEEIQWLKNVICYRNTVKIEEIAEQDRQEKERERLLDIERKHLMGLITYEEAVLAKKKLLEENKRKYEEFCKEKRSWNEEIERWRKLEMERNKKQAEKHCINELNVLHAKNENAMKKKEIAAVLKKESETMLAKALQVKQEELERRIKMIKEIKILEIIAKKARVPKIVDLTETAGMGFLCEMSIAELQERLSAMKIGLQDELERKKQLINEEKQSATQELDDAKKTIKNYMEERAQMRQHNKKLNNIVSLNKSTTKDIDDLKKILDEKRIMRMKWNNPLPL
ncbi:cilia- and flagella-associated protein 99-like [Anticarsia gemmatalis]|uniref:cilia- and flagella-associated protein 99-like n=1 Tax=Anticarsia gemmatalis TaxID=129554 RepID=UPI003F761857